MKNNIQKTFITTNSNQTKKLGEILAQEIRGGPASTRGNDCSSTRGRKIICLVGELGSGKTTFTQGFLSGLKIKGPYTSPTFLIMKEYKINKQRTTNKEQHKKQNVYHIDTYRVGAEDILALGWQEIISDKKNIVIVEWADKICDIIPEGAIWINFEWLDEKKRKITIK